MPLIQLGLKPIPIDISLETLNISPTTLSETIKKSKIKMLFLTNLLGFYDEIIKKRNTIFLNIATRLYNNKDKFHPLKWDHIEYLSNFSIPLICKSRKIRDDLVEKCNGKIKVRPLVRGDITTQPFFKKYIRKFKQPLSNSELIQNQGFYIGNNPDLTQDDIDVILQTLS